ncbi:MAG: hypothetical protein UT30_C0003G0007 [Candidatus Uhrbacteria bacterium GW2011_GWF2_39_13]|uniref:Uncharacterized protein n=1 Tax=Candidatus Uhrbacteria bacterium GW2011_GWF2_39_13 TaxID=1618995 RepID=A0A0G0MNW7_9BACT|nr:MAG: hypothetical protein UT30_C0003G0007 [Candidatus Uhrbacteria bacterium GW2011_GWF2_39_13]
MGMLSQTYGSFLIAINDPKLSFSMSTSTLRHHFNTFCYLPRQRDQRITKGLRLLRIHTSRRQIRRTFRELLSYINIFSYA